MYEILLLILKLARLLSARAFQLDELTRDAFDRTAVRAGFGGEFRQLAAVTTLPTPGVRGFAVVLGAVIPAKFWLVAAWAG